MVEMELLWVTKNTTYYHSANSKGFRCIVPGTDYKNQIYIYIYLFIVTKLSIPFSNIFFYSHLHWHNLSLSLHSTETFLLCFSLLVLLSFSEALGVVNPSSFLKTLPLFGNMNTTISLFSWYSFDYSCLVSLEAY